MNKSKAHICHINTTFIYKAGSARRTYYILKELVAHNYRVSLVVGRKFEISEEWDLRGIEVHQVVQLVKYVNPINDIVALLKIVAILRKISPEAVHTHLAKAGIVGRFAAKIAKVPNIFHTVHGPTFHNSLNPLIRLIFRSLERLTGRFTDSFVFVGNGIQDQYIKNRISNRYNSSVIRTGRPDSEIDDTLELNDEDRRITRKLLNTSQEDFVLIFVGRIVKSKQVDHAIRCIRRLLNSGLEVILWVVGEALLPEEQEYESTIKSMVESLNLTNSVKFLGFRHDALLLIHAADVLVLPSKYEGLPNVLVEAGLAGRPAVAYDVSGANEVLIHERTGYIIAANDENRLFETIRKMVQKRIYISEMGATAREKVVSQYRLSKTLKEKLCFYHNHLRDSLDSNGSK